MSVAVALPSSAQGLPSYTPEQVDAVLRNVLAKSPVERVRAYSMLVGHGLVPNDRLIDLGATLAAQAEIQADAENHSRALIWSSIASSLDEQHLEARTLAETALQIAVAADDSYGAYLAQSAIVDTDLALENVGSALARLLSTSQTLRDNGDSGIESRCLSRLAMIAKRFSANATAIGLFEQSLQVAVTAKEFPEAAQTITRIAELNGELGLHPEATRRIEEGLVFLEGETSNSASSMRYSLRTMLGRSMAREGRYAEAEQHLRSHIEATDSTNSLDVPLAKLALARTLIGLGELDEAVTLIEGATPRLDSKQPKIAEVHYDHALVQFELSEFEDALFKLDAILAKENPYSRDTRNKALRLRGQTLQLLGRIDESIECLLLAADSVRDNEVKHAQDRSVFLQAWNELAEQSRRQKHALEKGEITARADLAYQRYLRDASIVAGLAGAFLVALITRQRYRRKLVDAERRNTSKLNELLEQKLAAQTALLRDELETREQLTMELESNRKSEAIAALSSGMAHDFNNLLTVVIGSNEFIRIKSGSKLDLGSLQLLRESTRAARSGADITRQLMSITRRRVQTPKSIRLQPFLAEIHGLLQRTVGESVEIVITCTNSDLCVFVDETQLTTAVINLCVNARDAMNERGRITIAVGSSISEENGLEYAQIAVQDTGCGMTPEILEKARAPLFTTKSEGEGTGLGLSVVNTFVAEASGSLSLESQLGHGATCTLSLPTKEAVPQETPEAADPVRLDGLTIMVVEDKEAVLQSVSTTLGLLGCKVTPLSSAESAREVIEANGPPELLLCDIRMPGKTNGRELASWMRVQHPETPIVLMTGYTDRPLGDYPYIMKPFTPAELAETLAVARS